MLFILSVVLLFVFIMLICFLSLLVVIKIVPVVSLIVANGVFRVLDCFGGASELSFT